MRRTLLLLAVLAPLPLRAQVQPPPQVVVTGRGEVAVTADEAVVRLAVESREPTAALAGSQNAQKMRAVRDALVRAGIPADSVTTSAYSVRPNVLFENGRQRQEGYLAQNAVRVRTRRLDQVGRIIDAALAAGANRVDEVEFHASNTAEARREALARAIGSARADAEAMARAGGGSLGELLELTTSPSSMIPGSARIVIRGASSEQTAINASDINVDATVTARWRLIAR